MPESFRNDTPPTVQSTPPWPAQSAQSAQSAQPTPEEPSGLPLLPPGYFYPGPEPAGPAVPPAVYYGSPPQGPPFAPVGYFPVLPVPKPRSRTGGWLLVAASAAIAIGTLLPWASISIFGATLTVSGTSTGDGQLFFGVAVVSAIFGLLVATDRAGTPGKWPAVITLVAGLLVGIGGLYDLTNLSRRIAGSAGVAQIGPGIYISAFAGIAVLVLSIVVLAQRRA
jgi:hypothetical protein